ncbi:MAG: CdaR family protein [Thermodesulfovibrionales bacterium]
MRRLLTENLGLKISAILIALFLWYFVTSRGQSEMSVEVPIEFRNIPVGLGIVSSSSKLAVVNVRGQEQLMKNIKALNIRVMVDLSKAKKGEGTFYINKDEIKLPYAMTVTTVSPSSFRVRMDETATKTVVVTPLITGVPEQGYAIKTVEVEPLNIMVQGLKSDVRKITGLKTEALDITGLYESVSQNLDIDTAGTNVTPEVASVKVKVVITGRKK